MNNPTKSVRYAIGVIISSGTWVSYDLGRGPYLTTSPALRYEWETREEAEAQRPLYREALKVGLEVVEVVR